MRRTALILILLNSLATVTFAQQNQLWVFYSPSMSSGYKDRGYGAAFNHAWTPRFSTAIAVAAEDTVVDHCVGGFFTQECSEVRLRTYPVGLTGRLHFPNDTRWRPYVGLGLRYVGAPHLTPEAMSLIGPYSDYVHPQVIGGLEFLIKPSFGITVEVRGLVGSTEDYESRMKVSGGLSWGF